MPVRIGVIGIGFMGSAHFNIHRANPAAKVVAICDIDKKKLSGDWSAIGGNIAVGGGKVDLKGIKTYECADDLFADPDIDVVDITLPTYLHEQYAVKALKAGKHVLCEKPMARTSAGAKRMLEAAKKAKRKLFIGQCLRFWPGWGEAREIIRSKKYGKVISATFRRFSQLPTWGWENWLQDDAKSGLCALDMHIHDTDFILYTFGAPKAVTAQYAGFKKNRLDHIHVTYDYGQGVLITSEGAWEYKPAFGFTMGFIIHMEKATLTYQIETNKLMLDPASGPAKALDIVKDDGYIRELRHYVDCIAKNKQSNVCPPQSAMQTVALVEAEAKSAFSGRKVPFKTKKG
jgi:1,5-anhydro-D-fructose reductase (1,5-anhydro-D-mannitol-forming)